MSCGGRICVSSNPIDFIADSGASGPRSRLAHVFAELRALARAARRQRIWIEFEKVRQRRILLELDDRLLRDIGITREQAVREGQKRFWQ